MEAARRRLSNPTQALWPQTGRVAWLGSLPSAQRVSLGDNNNNTATIANQGSSSVEGLADTTIISTTT